MIIIIFTETYWFYFIWENDLTCLLTQTKTVYVWSGPLLVLLIQCFPPFSFPTEYNFLALQNTDSAVLLFKVAHSFSRARRFSWDRAILYRGARGNCRQTLQMIFRTRWPAQGCRHLLPQLSQCESYKGVYMWSWERMLSSSSCITYCNRKCIVGMCKRRSVWHDVLTLSLKVEG